MDNLSDFIPLLLIVGSVIISIVKSSEKKKAKQDQNKTTLPKGIPTIPTERPLGAPAAGLPKMRSVVVTPPPAQEKRRAHPADIAFNPEVRRSVQTTFEEHTSLDEVVVAKPFIFDAENIGELKKAVIYSEILNRKEY